MYIQKKVTPLETLVIPEVGIIAGGGYVPLEVAKNYRNLGIKVFIIAIEGEADLELFHEFSLKTVKLGEIKSVIQYLQDNLIKNIIFVGKIKRPNLTAIKVDLLGAKLIGKILKKKMLGDDSVLSIVADFFENQGFKVLSAKKILDGNNYIGSKFVTIAQPSKRDLQDINIGREVIRTLSMLDIGQATIVDNGYIIGIEAAEGTDALIERCASLRKNPVGGILIKSIKDTQNVKMDIPTIGPETIKQLIKFKYRGVAVELAAVIVAQPNITFEIANRNNIFIYNIER